jgi:hypothetical protein
MQMSHAAVLFVLTLQSGHGLLSERYHAEHWPKGSDWVYRPKSRHWFDEEHQPHKREENVASGARHSLQVARSKQLRGQVDVLVIRRGLLLIFTHESYIHPQPRRVHERQSVCSAQMGHAANEIARLTAQADAFDRGTQLLSHQPQPASMAHARQDVYALQFADRGGCVKGAPSVLRGRVSGW